MTALHRKLIRDLLSMKGQVLAICLVIACGVAMFVMSLATLRSLEQTQRRYYLDYRFAHIFAHLKRAPEALAERIAEIPGVAQVQTRIVADVTLDVPGLREPAVGRLISIPEYRSPTLNQLYLRRGRWIEPGQPGEVLVSEAFADAHDFKPGDTVRAILNGRREELRIVGIVLSPEYIFQIRQGDILPDDRRFGVFWMGERQLEAAFDMEGAFNDLALTVMHGASEAEIISRVDRLLEPYGSLGAYDRSDQVSNRYISDEIKQLRSMGLVAPSIFLGVAAFLLNIVMSRLIGTQREQIAALKAFGYTKLEIGLHYLEFVLVVVAIGAAAGTLVGAWMGRGLTELYTQFYRFPTFSFQFDFRIVVLALLISGTAAVLGTLAAVRRGVKLPPAEAMRPEPPKTFRPTLIERIGMQRLFSQGTRMILRHLEREPLKSFLSCLGIAMAVAILVLGNFSEDALDYLMDFQFRRSQRQDMTITFVEPTSGGVVHEVEHLPGVVAVEPFRAVPVRLRFGQYSQRVSIMGLPRPSRLYQLLDANETPIKLPPEGLLLSDKLGRLLGVEAGDDVTVEVLEGERPRRRIPVAGLVADYSGLSAYAGLETVHRLMREGNAYSGAFVSVDQKNVDELYREIKETPQIANVTVKQATLQSFRETIAENLLRMKTFNVIFAGVIAFGVVYNSARISLAERSRELATLRVIGFTRAEISAILLGELAVLTLAALPMGLGLGYLFAALLAQSLDTELYRIPLVIDPSTYAFAAVVIIVASFASGLIVRRRLDHLDLVSVLKSKE